ncbi:LETM1 domain-containing protein [Vulgatibacter incomptus]|uniref:Uncharacterized protein n=1 Tax=Vulgatibacter incomptus TaxID=1391653 RepID=A0A0K1PI13_9BACT|nr:LETM1 domain-containing protein [Vulgatibacter incomptus]AKU93183.1 hypothetical protein AKJ08_3570 [Vulgatibacter incomptus]
MDLQLPGWLADFFGRLLGGYDAEEARKRLPAEIRGDGPAPASLRRRALRHVDAELRRSGLVYGSPKLPSRVAQGARLDRAEALFFAVLSGKCFIALDIARLHGVPFEPQRSEASLAMLLAAGAGRADLADEIHALVSMGQPAFGDGRLLARLEQALIDAIAPATGDAILDLLLHNATSFAEARVIGRLAIAWYGEEHFDPAEASRLLAAAARERAQCLGALSTIAAPRGGLRERGRRALGKELRKLRLGRDLERQVRVSFTLPASPEELAGRIRTRTMRRFLVEQLYLANMLEGREGSPLLDGLASRLDFGRADRDALEAQVADYFYDPSDVFDAFELRAVGQASSELLVDRIAREVQLNVDRIALEVKETGELTQLLAKAAMGQKLTAEERAKAREQLIDLAKVVPSLAIIAAPGGMLIFAALLKVLPFSLLPSSFQKRPEDDAPLRPAAVQPRPRQRRVPRRS